MNTDQDGANQPGEGSSFEDRLAKAQARQAKAPKAGKDLVRDDMSGLGLMLRAGTEMVAALAVSVAIGLGLDRWLGTRVVFLILFVFLGAGTGVLNVWRLVGPGGKENE